MGLAIEARSLRKSFKDVSVLEDVSFSVQQGTVFALLGGNGAGKTTTINILTTLIRADGGAATVAGHDVASHPDKVRGEISLTGQFAAVDDRLTGRENLLLIGDLRHVDDPAATATDLLRRFGLEEAADRRVATFSGGMSRRLDVAMSLIGSPAVIFLDEPTTGFDPEARNEMWRTIRELAGGGTTVFLTTQYLEEADELADDIAILHQGRIVAAGTAAELKKLVPGGFIELAFHDEGTRAAAARELGKSYACREGDGATLTITTDGTVADVAGIFAGLRDAGIGPTEFSQKVATLDDAFLKIIGSREDSMTRTLADTWTLARRSLRHITRSPDTVITVLLMPIALMLLFVYVWGGAMRQQTGSVSYIDFIVPGIIVMTVLSGISYAAVRLNMDVQSGIINRFRTMPVAPSSILGGQVAASTVSNLFSSLVVLLVAFAMGFRSEAGATGWLVFAGILLLFTLATTWLAIFFGLLARTMEGAGAFGYILLLLVFISPSFVPTTSMTPFLRGFAEHQPMTPVVETMRSLLVAGTAGPQVWTALAWILGLLVVSYLLSVAVYKRKAIVVNT